MEVSVRPHKDAGDKRVCVCVESNSMLECEFVNAAAPFQPPPSGPANFSMYIPVPTAKCQRNVSYEAPENKQSLIYNTSTVLFPRWSLVKV